jgi:polyisoprenoid-binding protein YceI
MSRKARLLRPVLSLAVLGAALVSVPADAAIGKARDAAVSFFASGPAGLKIEGKTSELSVSEQGGKVRFVVPLANIDTGIGLRNKHMREKYLEVGKYPNAELQIDRAALKIPADGGEVSGSAPGTMTIHGQSKPVTVTYKDKRSGTAHAFEGSVQLDVRQFGIDIPSYAGVTVKPLVDVVVRAKVDDA